MHYELTVKILYSTDHLGEYALDEVGSQRVAVVTGYIKQITSRAVCENDECLIIIVVEGL
jgi:hypothetical protein